jgi:cytochrome c-type biogenesis protein CcmH
MMLLAIFVLMTAAALGVVIWPLARSRRLQAGASDLAVYRDQLEEIERDRADGRIGNDEFEAARIEVSRRLLAAAHTNGRAALAAGSSRGRRVGALMATGISIPVVAVSLYALLGSPDLPGQPFASRGGGDQNIGALIGRIEAHLEEDPEDGRGWEIVAPVYMKLDRYDDAVKARRNALRLLGATADREVDLGEALTAAAGGVITVEAKAAFDRAIATEADNFKAMFYLGLAADQDGKPTEAARQWRELIGKSPPDAPWLTVVQQQLARVEGTALPQPAPEDLAAAANMSPDQRLQFVRSMVERLATRLHQDGSDVDSWLRLLRAYMVLGDRDKAKGAVGDARAALAREPDKLRELNEGIKALGIEG